MNKKAKELVKQMTLEEKCSLLSGKDFWHLKGVERLGIPSIMVTDGPHGLRKQAGKGDHVGLGESVKATCFPTASLLASSWDEDLIKKVGEYLGEECLSEEVSVLLGPGANIKRHPLCGRNFEYFSEDPLLSGKMASAWINGIQEKGVGASLKHYVANNQEAFRLVVNAVIDERTLREIYLKSFEIAVKESQPWTVMCSYNQVNGDYLAENKKLLTDVLKKEWQHKGLVVTDWGANNDRVKGLLAGQELEMPASKGFNDKLVYKQIKKGIVDEKILDERVERIVDLILKASNTLKEPRTDYNQELHHELARKVAAESMILLKNENDILPIKKDIKVGLIGEFAKKPRYQGSGSSIISPHVISDAYSAFKEVLGENLVFASGYSLETDEIDQTLIDEAVKAVKSCDVVVIMAGLTDKYESEGFDRDHLDLPMNHNALIEAIAKEHNQVIVALANGAPVRMPWLNDIQGLLEQYLGGEASGEALADVCFGIVNPSGKLPETFPNSLEELPSNQNFPGKTRQVEYREGQYIGYRFYDTVDKKPLFPFGFGLSYSKFKYSDIQIETKDNSIKIKLTISNESDVSGKEVIQVYVGKKSAKIYRPKKELKAFKKVEVSANMSEKVEINIDFNDLKIFNDNVWKLEAGQYEIHVGNSSRNIFKTENIEIESLDVISKEKAQNYFNITKDFSPTDEDFKALLGYDIPKPRPIKPYDINSTFGEVKNTFVGKRLHKIIKREIAKTFKDSNDEVALLMIDHMLEEMPIRSLVMFSDGVLSFRRAQGLIDLMNKRICRGLFKLMIG